MNARRLAVGVVLFGIVVLIASVFWFVELPDENTEQFAPVVVNAPDLEAADESQRVFRIAPDQSTAMSAKDRASPGRSSRF